ASVHTRPHQNLPTFKQAIVMTNPYNARPFSAKFAHDHAPKPHAVSGFHTAHPGSLPVYLPGPEGRRDRTQRLRQVHAVPSFDGSNGGRWRRTADAGEA